MNPKTICVKCTLAQWEEITSTYNEPGVDLKFVSDLSRVNFSTQYVINVVDDIAFPLPTYKNYNGHLIVITPLLEFQKAIDLWIPKGTTDTITDVNIIQCIQAKRNGVMCTWNDLKEYKFLVKDKKVIGLEQDITLESFDINNQEHINYIVNNIEPSLTGK